MQRRVLWRLRNSLGNDSWGADEMPKPIYIVCSDSGSEDRITGKFSLYGCFEKVQILKMPTLPAGDSIIIGMPGMWITALWARLPEDDGVEFEWVMSVHLPLADAPTEVGKGFCIFDNEFKRICVRTIGPLPFAGPGSMIVRSRIRPQDGEWLSQEFAIIVQEISQDQPSTILPLGQ